MISFFDFIRNSSLISQRSVCSSDFQNKDDGRSSVFFSMIHLDIDYNNDMYVHSFFFESTTNYVLLVAD